MEKDPNQDIQDALVELSNSRIRPELQSFLQHALRELAMLRGLQKRMTEIATTAERMRPIHIYTEQPKAGRDE